MAAVSKGSAIGIAVFVLQDAVSRTRSAIMPGRHIGIGAAEEQAIHAAQNVARIERAIQCRDQERNSPDTVPHRFDIFVLDA